MASRQSSRGDVREEWRRYKEEIVTRLRERPELVYGRIQRRRRLGNGWVEGLCPFHRDSDPSFGYHEESLHWVCFVCGKGSVFDFVMQSSGISFKDTAFQLGDQLGVPRPVGSEEKPQRPPIREDLVKQWCRNLWQNEEVIRWLREKRGLSDDTLRKYEIGWDPKRQRNTIPVRDERGNLVNVRLYNAKKDPKIINFTEGRWKYGSPARLYGVGELQKDNRSQVIQCEGEWDRLVLQQESFLAVTSTHGCSVFRPEWVKHFQGRDVVVIYDCDSEGKAAVNNIVLKAFREAVTSGKVKSIKVIDLPLRGEKDDKDVTDYFHKRGFTASDLQRLIDETPAHSYEDASPDEEVIRLDSFTEIERKDLINKKVEVEITICGETSEAFHAVERFKVTYCSRLRKGECFDCAEPIVVPRGAQEYIGSCMSTNVQLKGMLRDFCCRFGQKPAIEITERTTVKEFFCHQKVSRVTHRRDETGEIVQIVDGRKQELVEKRVYFLSSEHPTPGNYRAVGWVKSHPKTQQVTMLIESLEALEDDFQAFRTEENVHLLKELQELTLHDIVASLREHVTRVYLRDELLLSILLTYCSPRWFRFKEEIERGWLCTAIIGDTGTGKTQTFDRFAEFLGIGDMFSGLTGSRTGLAYALVEHKQKGWQVRIGRYPANSRRLLAVDEVQEIPRSQLKTIAKAMNEGFLQIDRVSSRGYESQTRVVMLGNPKRNATMDEHQHGCTALKPIFPLMVIRRIDIAVFANSNDVEIPSFAAAKSDAGDVHQLSRDALRALIFWAWNLKHDDVLFLPETAAECKVKTEELSDIFGHATDIPLLTVYECDKKLARVAAAFAVLDLSVDEGFAKLVVLPKHICHAAQFLTNIYSHDNCRLDTYSDVCREQEALDDFDGICREFGRISEREKHSSEGEHVFQRLVHGLWTIGARKDNRTPVRRNDLADVAGCSPRYVSDRIHVLKKFHLIESTRDGYVKTPKFNRFMAKLQKEKPEFLAEVVK